MRHSMKSVLMAAATFAVTATWSAAETIKIAFIDPLSGPFASTGSNGLKQYQFAAQHLINDKGGVLGGHQFEIVAFDNKISPQETLVQLQIAIDQDIRFIAQGNSSGVAHALTDAINKHNRRNPDKRVLFLNYAAVDPALTNDDCNFWHFRFDANADIKMDALTDVIQGDESIKKIYVIGQDYSFGKAVAAAAVRNLTDKRPDIEIVGNELHPIGKVKDFTPYARKIVASGADAVITGNWGSDMLNLGKSVIDNGFSGSIFNYYAASDGITAAFAEKGKGILKQVTEGAMNPPTDEARAYFEAFRAVYPDGDVSQPRITNVIEMLAKAINEAGSATDVVAIANALEGMEHQSFWGSKVYIRPQDHQAIQNVHIMEHTDEEIVIDFDNSAFGTRILNTVEMSSMDMATSCKMRRP